MKIKFKDNGTCMTFTNSGKLIAKFKTPYEPVFNNQYGTSLSLDGGFLFIGTWRKGLFCYSTSTGELIWRHNPSGIRQIIAFKEFILVEMHGRGIFKRRLKDGKIIDIFKMTAIDFLFYLNRNQIFTGPKNNNYFVMTPKLKIIRKISRNTIDPENHLSLIINGCKKSGKSLIIWGFKQYLHGKYDKSKAIPFKVRL